MKFLEKFFEPNFLIGASIVITALCLLLRIRMSKAEHKSESVAVAEEILPHGAMTRCKCGNVLYPQDAIRILDLGNFPRALHVAYRCSACKETGVTQDPQCGLAPIEHAILAKGRDVHRNS